MNLIAVLTTGLFAGGVSCAAVQGGLLTGLITRQRTPAAQTKVGAGKCARRRREPEPPPRTWREQLGDDLTPVGGFLAGKLVSHTVAGALLGLVGSAMQLSAGLQTWLQIGAGLLIVTFGLAQLGAPGFRNFVIEPPRSWTRYVRGQARSQTALAPAILGFATILIPCGVTLSVAALAMASGSALAGAATMAVFVVGTVPLFALLGYAARKAATVWKGRLALLTGLVVLAMGLYTLNGGLERAGSPMAASRIGQTLGFSAEPPDTSTVSVGDGRQVAVITATTGSYSPRNVQVKAGVPTTLVVRSENAEGCVLAFVIPSLGEQGILPATGETRIELGKLRPGTLDYSCGMGMYTGVITVV